MINSVPKQNIENERGGVFSFPLTVQMVISIYDVQVPPYPYVRVHSRFKSQVGDCWSVGTFIQGVGGSNPGAGVRSFKINNGELCIQNN